MKPLPERQAPAFQCYAADDLASATYYLMNLAERGLLDAIRRACWVDGAVPRRVEDLAMAIRRPVDEVAEHLTGRVLAHFVVDPEGQLRCVELDRQRSRLNARRDAQQRGASMTNAGRDGKRDAQRDGKRDGKRGDSEHAKRDASEQNRTEGFYQEEKKEPTSTNVSRRTSPAGARARGNGAAEVAQ